MEWGLNYFFLLYHTLSNLLLVRHCFITGRQRIQRCFNTASNCVIGSGLLNK
jgi:hypothetical protein